jgi:hypothetical protein
VRGSRLRPGPDSRKPVEEEEVKLHCPVCHAEIDEVELMLEHLMKEHEISKRQARFLVQKLQEWKEKALDPDLFPNAPQRWDGPETTGRRWRR